MKFSHITLVLTAVTFSLYAHSIEIKQSDIVECETRPQNYKPSPPSYPALSRRKYESGRVILEVTINENGCPINISVKASSGFARLDNAAENWAKNINYINKNKTYLADVPVTFELETPEIDCISYMRKEIIADQKADFQYAHELAVNQCIRANSTFMPK